MQKWPNLLEPSQDFLLFAEGFVRRLLSKISFSAKVLIFIFCAWLSAETQALPSSLRFTRIGSEQGLKQSDINQILQDRLGFIWIATQNGLLRYDGKTFQSIKGRAGKEYQLSSQTVLAICEGQQGILWLATNEGLDRYDSELGLFEHLLQDSKKKPATEKQQATLGRILCLNDQAGVGLWLGTENGLWLLDQSRKLTAVALDSEGRAPRIHALLSEAPDKLWIGGEGLCLRVGSQVERLTFPEGKEPQVLTLVGDGKGGLWIGTKTDGLFHYEPKSQQWQQFVNQHNQAKSLVNNKINALLLDQSGRLWLGSDVALSCFDAERGTFQHYWSDPLDTFSLSSNRVSCLYQSREGVLWFGTNGGLNRLNPSSFNFEVFRPSLEQDSIQANSIWGFYADGMGSLWIGTDDSGLERMDLKTGLFRQYENDSADPKQLAHTRVAALLNQDQDHLWLATERGLRLFEISSGHSQKVATQVAEGLPIAENGANCLLRDRQGVLWVGTDIGLYRYENQEFRCVSCQMGERLLLTHNRILSLCEDREGSLWVGTIQGVNRIDAARKEVKQFQHDPDDPTSLSENFVLSLCLDHLGRVWVGSAAGLSCFLPATEQFKNYGSSEGLANEVIFAIVEDSRQMLWLTTNEGMSCFDPVHERFRHFGVSNGLQGREFNQGSALKLADGRICVGGVGGFTIFHPERVMSSLPAPATRFSQFLLYNVPVLPRSQDPNSPLERALSATSTLELDAKHAVFSLEFAAIHYANPVGNRYRYRLEGFDDRWTYTSADKNFATYTILPPGNYRFQVNAISSDGVQDPIGANLQIQIHPPWWKTRLAYFCFFCLLLGAVIGVPALRIRYLQLHRRELEALVKVKTQTLLDKNQEMELLDRIVQRINSEMEYEVLVQSLLEQCLKLIPHAAKGLILLRSRDSRMLRAVASVGYPEPWKQRLSLTDEQASGYFAHPENQLEEGIFQAPLGEEALLLFQEAQSAPLAFLTMMLKWNSLNVGFLLLESEQGNKNFDQRDLERLRRFRQHAVSAIAKTSMLFELRETTRKLQEVQEELVAVAHRAGMSEIVTNVLHNIGNLLNSANTSWNLLQETLEQEKSLNMLLRVSDLITAEAQNLVEFFSDNPRGKHLPKALQVLSSDLRRKQEQQTQEVKLIGEKLEEMRIILHAQEEYASGTFFGEALSLESLIQNIELLQKEALRKEGISWRSQLAPVRKIQAQKLKLIQVIQALLNNAVETLRETQQSEKWIWVELKEQEQWVQLKIEDNGKDFHSASAADFPKRVHYKIEWKGIGTAFLRECDDRNEREAGVEQHGKSWHQCHALFSVSRGMNQF